MGILVFILVLIALILVHEFGHFIVAKWSGMRVDEFGLGYPPRALLLAKRGETEYTLNWLPFGGFVKIYGEDGVPEQAPGAEGSVPPNPRAFGARPRILQALVLVAGVTMNIVFAYVLLAGGLIVGMPRALTDEEALHAKNVSVGIAMVLPGSPAERAGLVPGDTIISATDAKGTWVAQNDPAGFTPFVAASVGEPVTLAVRHNEQTVSLTATPAQHIVESDPSRYALGVAIGTVGVVPLSVPRALAEGARITWGATKLTAVGLWDFFYGIFAGHANFSQVAGPVGIAGVVGGASRSGLGDLLSIAALISINLALINLLPIPALDGGRLLVVIIEGVTRRKIPQAALSAATSVSFALLVLLMIVVTAHDIYRISA